ncbi:Bet v1-like protein [Martensiomyces pterosporus]|nr:Bet v1-like protein [Martensiomyces pterosporus]
MSSHNVESRVIKAPVEKVWDALRSQDFKFWSIVKSVEQPASATEVGSTRKVAFNDGTVQQYRLVEFSELKHSLTYEIVESEPAVPVLSAQHTIHVLRVSADDTAFVQWSSDFSSDGSSAAVQDSKYKKLEALADLAKALEN